MTVEQSEVVPTAITVSPSSKTIKVGGTFTASYSLTPSNAVTSVTWSSDDSSIASVSSTGKVTGVKAGSTYINAVTTNGKAAYCRVTVEQGEIAINATNFPDEIFRNWLLEQDYGKDGKLTEEEIKKVTELNVNGKGIRSLQGIEYFTALTKLNCYYNQLTALDVSKNTALTYLRCSSNKIKGGSMDNLINSLPTQEEARLYVYSSLSPDEGNVCTKKQVKAAKEKGWTAYYQRGEYDWQEYEGSDDTSSVADDIRIDASKNVPVYNLRGERLTAPQKGVNIIGGRKVVVK